MSTILTIITKEPKVRVIFNQPLRRISGIQLLDYNFPEEHVEFKKLQTLSRGGTVLANFPPGNYSFVDLVTSLNHGISGIKIHGLMNEVHVYNSSSDLTFSSELKKILNVVDRKPVGTNYSISWTLPKYHLFVNFDTNSGNLGLIAKHDDNDALDKYRAKPTSLLAAIPSMSNTWPFLEISEKYTVNYLDLSLLLDNGEEVNFDGKQFRISLKVTFST